MNTPTEKRVADLLTNLVLARQTNGAWRPGEDEIGLLGDSLERAILDRRLLEAYLSQLLRLWVRKPPSGVVMGEELLVRVRAEGLRAVPADQLVRLAVEPIAVLGLRDAVYGDELPPYWFDRLRALEPRIDQVRDDILAALSPDPVEAPDELANLFLGGNHAEATVPAPNAPERWTVSVASPGGEVRVEFSWYAADRWLDVRLFGAVTLTGATGTARLTDSSGAVVAECEADTRRFPFHGLPADPRGSGLLLTLEVRPVNAAVVRLEMPVERPGSN